MAGGEQQERRVAPRKISQRVYTERASLSRTYETHVTARGEPEAGRPSRTVLPIKKRPPDWNRKVRLNETVLDSDL